MVFITLKLFSENIREFFNFTVFVLFLSNCYRGIIWTGPLSFLVQHKLFCLVSVLSEAILTVIRFFLNGHKVLQVINVCCCLIRCSS